MKGNVQVRGRGGGKGNTQQAIFELKHRIVLALNKLSDRDTCQIGVDELEKIAGTLTPDGVGPFLSCVLDTDKEQKSAVRRECVRSLGALAMYQERGVVVGHVGKMVGSIVKRLRDPDSVVRDACVETMGVLASRLSDRDGAGSADGVFIALVKPLFEALGEQNKQMQCGTALCLARVIDNVHDPPIGILQRMLPRSVKMLKNPHFLAKPAMVELNRSIVQAGGAPSQSLLSAAVTGIQEALKDSDWTTRKAACVALTELASTAALFMAPFRASCIRSLESCRFDKVKPVRDLVLHALQCWKSLTGSDASELSETGSSIKENFCGGDYSDFISTGNSAQKDVAMNKVVKNSSTSRVPLSMKKPGHSCSELQHPRADDWHIEITVPKSRNVSVADYDNDESEGSSITKTVERTSADISTVPDSGCEYVPMDDKQECSSVSNTVSDSFETKFVAVSHDCIEEDGLLKSTGRSKLLVGGGISEEQTYCAKMLDRRSLDSTVTETISQITHGCCSQAVNEMAYIRQKLLEIESKQSNLMEMLQVFSTGIMDNLSMLQTKVSGLEQEVDTIANAFVQGRRYPDTVVSKLMKQNHSVLSPRNSTCTPRPSTDSHSRPSLLSSAKSSDIWEEDKFSGSRTINYSRQGAEVQINHAIKPRRHAVEKGINRNLVQAQAAGQTRKVDASSGLSYGANPQQNGQDTKNLVWRQVKGFLCKGDLDSAYYEALCSGEELVLMELLKRTGPVLESLSDKTIGHMLSVFISYLLEQRFTSSIIPWLQQVVHLSSMHGPDYLTLSAKSRRELLTAVQEAAGFGFSSPAEKRSVSQLAAQLRQIWGNC